MCAHPEGGHIGPPLQKINYLYERNLVLVTKWEHISREDQRRHPVVAWFLSHYQFYYQRGPFVLYYRPGGRLAARLASGAAKPAK